MAGAHGSAPDSNHLRHALLGWFDRHKRDLPWRRTRDPYAIWVSEVMLQQTRVAAVLEHYARWMARFPTIASLAAAGEPEVLALWSGLGYYRRARFLHAGAQAVVREHGSTLPRTARELRTLPGIGAYTSAAIASIAFGEPVAVVDGNVERVVLRLHGGSSSAPEPAAIARTVEAAATQMLDRERPGDWNQAVMELGATVCLPRAPLCLHCPVQPWCAMRGEHPTPARKQMRSVAVSYSLATRTRAGTTEVLLHQRAADSSLMAGMWELPLAAPEQQSQNPAPLLVVRHAITVTNYSVRVLPCAEHEAATLAGAPHTRWIAIADLPETALTGLARKVLRRLHLWPPAPTPLAEPS